MYSLPSSLSSKRVMAFPAGATGAVKSSVSWLSPACRELAGKARWPFSAATGTEVPLI